MSKITISNISEEIHSKKCFSKTKIVFKKQRNDLVRKSRCLKIF